mgnify:CR=1 FL=1
MSIKYLAQDDRPREKFLLKGKQAVSDSELLAIIMGSGSRNESAVDLARRILDSVDNNWRQLSDLSLDALMTFKGVGETKAITIAAAMEIGRRKSAEDVPDKPQITSSQDAYKIVQPYLSDLKTEEFWCLYLNQSNKVIHLEKLTQGGINKSIVDVRSWCKIALEKYATAIIVAHNHPSGNLQPSSEDKNITKKMSEGGQLLNITLLDHLIITQKSYYSFSDEGLL